MSVVAAELSMPTFVAEQQPGRHAAAELADDVTAAHGVLLSSLPDIRGISLEKLKSNTLVADEARTAGNGLLKRILADNVPVAAFQSNI